MRFVAPEWALLLPLLIALGFFWRGLQLQKPLRALCLLLATALLMQPQWRHASDGLDLWVLVDRSQSVADRAHPPLPEWLHLLEQSRSGADRLQYIDFAAEALKRDEGDGSEFPANRGQTRLASAVHYALSRLAPDRAARLLVLSDGFSTEPLDGVAERLVRQNIALDYRLLVSDATDDFRIVNFQLPERAQVGEPFLLDLEIAGPLTGTLPLEILRDGQPVAKQTATLRDGIARVRLSDRLPGPGAHRYEARLLPEHDPIPGNNVAARWIEIAGGPRVLLVSNYADDPLAATLRAQGFAVEIITNPREAAVGQLNGAKLVILNNVPAYQLAPDFLNALEFFVTSQGGGLLMAGGRTSFASGGYFGSAIEPLLPVSMELRQEHRKLAVAMAIVLDRSGSMSANVPGSTLQKMNLADEGAAQAIQLLGEQDQAAVFAVDMEAHEVVPLTTIAGNRDAMMDAARRIQSAGGGIAVPTGLRAAWEALKKSSSGQRHVVLFADANDATQELGDYQTLIADMQKDGITISVIGMGTDQDSGAKFLNEVATLGQGRIFFNADPAQLPGLFTQETVTLARSAFIKDPVALLPQSGWLELAAKPLEWPKVVDGYNLSYLKPNATAAALSGDEYAAPLVAFWQHGTGRAAAVSFPLGGDFSATVRAWPRYGDFAQTLARWLMGEPLPPGIGLRSRVDGTRLMLDLLHDETWNDRLAKNAPQLLLANGAHGKPTPVVWERIEPGHYRATSELAPGEFVRGAVTLGPQSALSFGPLAATVNPEWNFDPARVQELKAVAQASGGQERLDLASVWRTPRPPAWLDLQTPLLITLLIALLLEALQTRTGWRITAKP